MGSFTDTGEYVDEQTAMSGVINNPDNANVPLEIDAKAFLRLKGIPLSQRNLNEAMTMLQHDESLRPSMPKNMPISERDDVFMSALDKQVGTPKNTTLKAPAISTASAVDVPTTPNDNADAQNITPDQERTALSHIAQVVPNIAAQMGLPPEAGTAIAQMIMQGATEQDTTAGTVTGDPQNTPMDVVGMTTPDGRPINPNQARFQMVDAPAENDMLKAMRMFGPAMGAGTAVGGAGGIGLLSALAGRAIKSGTGAGRAEMDMLRKGTKVRSDMKRFYGS